MVEVKQSNPDAFKELDIKLKQLNGMETRVGWFNTAKYEDGTPVAQVAAWNEMGNSRIPPRPFMRPAIKENENKWKDIAARVANAVLNGKMTGEGAMDAIGQTAEDDVAQAIVDVTSPPLSPLTIAIRKYKQMGKKISGRVIGEIAAKLEEGKLDTSGVSTKPLNDTGYMISTLTHITENKK